MQRILMRLAVALGVVVGGLLLAASPASSAPPTPSEVAFTDDCLGTEVAITSGTYTDEYDWTITVDGEHFWPEEDADPTEAGESATVEVPAGEISVDFEGSPPSWPKSHTWERPAGCADPTVEFEDICFGIKISLANGEDATANARFFIQGIGWVDHLVPGHSPEPILYSATEVTLAEQTTGQDWEHEWTKPDDCEGEETPGPSETPSAAPTTPAPGAAGGLPVTGSKTAVAGVGSMLLLGVGTALFLVTRRRRITWTS